MGRALTFAVYRGTDLEREVRLDRPVIKIGRHGLSDIVLDHPDVGRMHAVIEVTDEEILIIDLGVEGGTLLDGTRVNKGSVDVGDSMGIGPFRLILESVGTAAARYLPEAPAPDRGPCCARCAGPLCETSIGGAGHAYRDLPLPVLRCAGCAVTYADIRSLEGKLGRKVRLSGSVAERARRRARGQCPLCRDSLDTVTLSWGGDWVMVEECTSCGLLALEHDEMIVLARLAAIVS